MVKICAPVPKNEFALAINGGINSVYPLTPVFVSKKKLYKDYLEYLMYQMKKFLKEKLMQII